MPVSTSSCTSITFSRPWDLTTENIYGGKNIWPRFNWWDKLKPDQPISTGFIQLFNQFSYLLLQVQFFVVGSQFAYLIYNGCARPMWLACGAFVYNVTLISLFFSFYRKAYKNDNNNEETKGYSDKRKTYSKRSWIGSRNEYKKRSWLSG